MLRDGLALAGFVRQEEQRKRKDAPRQAKEKRRFAMKSKGKAGPRSAEAEVGLAWKSEGEVQKCEGMLRSCFDLQRYGKAEE